MAATSESTTVCEICRRPFFTPDEAIHLVEIDRFILSRQHVEVEGRNAPFHPGCVELAQPYWRRARDRGR